jgi:hypothetical protein
MLNRFGEECRWQDSDSHQSLESLQAILNCASLHGCRECVPCSEKALEMFRKAALDGQAPKVTA